MSRSYKRNLPEAMRRIDEQGGRIPIIRKSRDCNVSHSGDCWMCEKGTRAKRVMYVKPRRRNERRDLRERVAEYQDGQR